MLKLENYGNIKELELQEQTKVQGGVVPLVAAAAVGAIALGGAAIGFAVGYGLYRLYGALIK